MSTAQRMVVMTADELRELLSEVVRAALPQATTASRWKWLGPTMGPRRFGISQESWAKLLASGKLPYVERPSRGGPLTKFVRETDAVRYFTPKGADA